MFQASGAPRRAALRRILTHFVLAGTVAGPLPSQEPTTRPVDGGGGVLTESLRPAAGALVRVTNVPPDAGDFATRVGPDGRFSFRGWRLTERVSLEVSWEPFYRPATLSLLREQLASGGVELLLDPVRVDIAGRVELDGAGPGPVAGAELFALGADGAAFLAASGADGRVLADGVPIEVFGDAARGELEVRLPDRLTLAGEFAGGPAIRRSLPLDPRIDLGTLRFRRLPPPAGAVTLAGRLYVRDSLDAAKRRPVHGLRLVAVRPETGAVAAAAVVTEGSWSLQLSPGTYRIEAPNARDLGLAELKAPARPILADRRDLENGLDRPVPGVVGLERGGVVFSYRLPSGLAVEDVALRVGGELVEGLAPERLGGDRYRVRPPYPLAPGAAVEVAVRIDGLLTRFSPAAAVPGGGS